MDYEDMNVSFYGENSSSGEPNGSHYMDYDRDESFSLYYLEELIPVALIYGITLIVGLIGNVLIIYTVISFRRMRTISNVFLASLATADLLLVLICVPVKFGQLFSYTWTLGEFGCKSVHYVQNVSALCSVFTLTAMSVERYYAIMHPVKSRYQCTMSKARKMIFVIWCLSFLLATPIIYVQIHLEVGERYKAHWCVRDWFSPWAWRMYEVYMMLLILIFPSLIMGFTYTKICHQLWVVVKDRASMSCGEMPGTEIALRETRNQYSTNSSLQPRSKPMLQKLESDNATVKQVIKMLVAVVVLFILCWAPILITNLLTSLEVLERLNYGYLKPLRTAFHLLSYFNSCINPCVYGFLSANFRSSFRAALSTCLCRRGRVERGFSRTATTSVSYAKSTFIT